VAARIEAAQGEGFLRALKAEWEAHNKSVQMIRDILMYMDRIYVKQQAGAALCMPCSAVPGWLRVEDLPLFGFPQWCLTCLPILLACPACPPCPVLPAAEQDDGASAGA
jgi:hypothetical protein